MYLVSVRDIVNGKRVALIRFEFGQWQEIGYWLDDKAFIAVGFRVTITMIEEHEFRSVPKFNMLERAR